MHGTRRRNGEAAAWQDYGYGDGRGVELAFVHVRYGVFGGGGKCVEDVGCAAVDGDCVAIGVSSVSIVCGE